MKKLSLLSTMMLFVIAAMLPQYLNAQVSVWDGTYAPWTNGTGTEADPFLIENAQQLAYLTYRVNNGLDAGGGHVSNHDLHYKLMTDVNLNGSQNFQWTPIGYWNSTTDYYCFGGHFDGNNHTVSGLYINSSADRVGFFGYIDESEIINLNIAGYSATTSGQYAGGLIGLAISSTVVNCYSTTNVSIKTNVTSYCGGLIGSAICYSGGSTNIKGCRNLGTISVTKQSSGGGTNTFYVGGIVGSTQNSTTYAESANITNCYNTGDITLSGNSYCCVGGIVGFSSVPITIRSCYNNGVLISRTTGHGNTPVGGIIGSMNTPNNLSSSVKNCYNTGNITIVNSPSSYQFAGGCVGMTSGVSNEFIDCYNTGSLSAAQTGGINAKLANGTTNVSNCYYLNTCGGSNTYGGSPMSSSAMQTSDFVDIINNGTCAFEQDFNQNVNSGYPILTMYILQAKTIGNTNVTQSHAQLIGSITMENDVLLSSGFMYRTATDPHYSFVACNNVDDTLRHVLSGLVPSTNYTYKTYLVTAGCDTTFGEDKNFTTASISVTTSNATNVTQTHATLNGTLTTGDANIVSQGFEYKKNTDTVYQIVNVSENGTVQQIIANLAPGTQYTYRTFCTAVGCSTIYGVSKTFTTSSVSVDNYAANVTQTQATLYGSLSMGDATVTNQGFVYKQSGGAWTTVSVPYNNSISYTLSDLTPNTKYYFRVFVTANECGTIYGQTQSFTTSSVSSTTNNATNLTQTHATLNGSFTIGDANMSSYGFEYGKTTDTVFQTVMVTGDGNVSETVTGLSPNTQYTYRTFCTAVGCEPVYGYYRNFTTQAVSVTTNPATNLTESSVTLNGSMYMGDATVTTRGFEYCAVGDTSFLSVTANSTANAFSATLYNLPVNSYYEYRAFVEIAESTERYYGYFQFFEVSWLNADTILVNDATMLQWVADRCNSGSTFEGKYIKLMNDITLPLNQPNNMTSIGTYPSCPFKGTFDGNGKLVSNLYIDQPNTEYQGFFGYTLNANLYEVGLVNITASGRNYTGGMVAYSSNTYMRDCYVSGGSLFALSYCGGLVGYQDQGTNSIISGCYNTCTVSGNHYVGGLVGFSNYSTVRNSYVAASVTGQGTGIGAIIGGANEVLMYNCYFSSSITGQTNAIGENNFKTGEGMSDEDMRAPAFVTTLNQGLVVPVWKSDYAVPINNGFPILIWQSSENVQISGDTVICNGMSTTLTASSGTSYVWSTGATGQSITVNTPGNYSVTVTKSNGNNYTVSVNVTAMEPVSIMGNTHICSGQSTTLSANGTGNYTWSNGSHNSSVTITSPGTYTVTVSQSNGCTSSASTVVTAASLPTPVITGNTTLCQGQTTTLTANGGISYNWSNDSTTNSINVSQSGIYTVTATNAEGCSASTNVTVTVNPLPNVNISGNNSFCQGDNITLSATGANTYMWSNNQSSNAITVSNAGTYTVTGTDANGCTNTATKTVSVNPTYNIPLTHSICEGESYNFYGQNITAAGTYTHTLQTVNGCDSVLTLVVTVKTLPTIAISGNTTLCEGETTTLTANGGISYNWSNGSATNSINVAESGVYTVIATNVEGCSAIATATVTVNPLPIVVISGNTSICEGGSTTLTASGADTYSWSTGDNTTSATINAFGIYNVTGTSAVGCSSVASVTVLVSQLPVITITGETDICAGESTTLTANGGTTYLWSNGTTDATLTVSNAGTYQVIGYNEDGCNAIASATVNVWQPATSEFSVECLDSCYTWNDQSYCISGDYTQTLQTVYGCDSVVTLHLTITVGIDELQTVDFKVYPNPTSNIFNVQCTMNNVQAETTEMRLYDAYGRLLDVVETLRATSLQTDAHGSSVQTQIDLSRYATGVYFVKAVADGKTVAVRKVVKQ